MNGKVFRLTTIRFSHFNEKARWGLDRFNVPYYERPLMPVFHFAVTPWVVGLKGRRDKQSTRFSTPILRTDRGEILAGSGEILRYTSDRFSDSQTNLYWDPETAHLEEQFTQTLFPATRSWAYFHALTDASLMSLLAYQNVGPMQAAVFNAALPLVRMVIFRSFHLTAERMNRIQEKIRMEFEAVEVKLRGGAKFLLGDRFSAADLSFACAAAPALLVSAKEGYGAALPPLERAHAKARIFAQELRSRPAGEFVLRLFQQERGARQIPCVPKLEVNG